MAKNDDNDINESINNIIELKKLTKSENSIKDLKKSRNTTKKDKSHYKFKSKNEIAFKESYLRSKESNSKTKLQKVPPKQKKTVTRKKTTEPYLEDSSPNLESKYNKELKGQRLAYKTKKRNKVENQTSSKLKNIKNIAQKSKKTKKSPLDKNALSEKENKKSIFNNLFKTKPIHKTFQDQIADLTDSISSHKKYISLDYSKTDYSNIKTTKFEPKIAIDVKNVTMLFKLNTEKVDNLKEYFIKTVKGEIKTNELLALDNVSFTIKKGERWGIIGLNGAGKSTLLKIIAGVMKPTEGDVDVFGKVAPLLELGAGFDHNYTGRENIYLNGAILGYSKEFIEEKYDDIVEFSGLEKFIEVPIKNYSSGMKTKLGFSIATLVEPDILILDEILSVGDAKFRKKSGDKIKSMFDSGITVILVSHSINQIKDLCDKALWLENGKIVMIGEVNEVCQAYEESTK